MTDAERAREIERTLRELARLADSVGAPKRLTLPERWQWITDSVKSYIKEK